MNRNTLRSLMRFLFKCFSQVEVIGLDTLPAQGGYILAANHLGRLDAPLVFAVLERQDANALVADKYKKNPLINWMVETVHGIWIHREDADIHALREARKYLQAGGLLGIAPEGTRSQTGGLARPKTGVAYLADKAGVSVIPLAITGTENAIRQLLRLRRPHLRVQFGAPFALPPLVRENREQALQDNTDEIMCRIAAMLPPAYRGVYASHPRLQAILANSLKPAPQAPIGAQSQASA